MVKKSLLFVSLVLALLLSAIAATPTPAAEPITLSWGSYPPIGDIRTLQCIKAINWLEERSNGRIKIKFFPAEQLYNANEMWNATRDGLIDIGYINTSAFNGIEPIFEIATSPAGITTQNWYAIMRRDGLFDKVITPAFKKNRMVALWGVPTGGQDLIFNKPVRKLEDMKGLLMRSVGGGTDLYLKSYGANPVRIASSEVYIAAQRGTIQGATHSITSIISYKEYEILPYMVDDKFGNGFTTMAMNVNSFNSLPADLQQIVVKTFRDVENDWMTTMYTYEVEQMAFLKKQPKFDLYVLPPKELARWIAARQPYWADFQKRVGAPAVEAVNILKKYWK